MNRNLFFVGMIFFLCSRALFASELRVMSDDDKAYYLTYIGDPKRTVDELNAVKASMVQAKAENIEKIQKAQEDRTRWNGDLETIKSTGITQKQIDAEKLRLSRQRYALMNERAIIDHLLKLLDQQTSKALEREALQQREAEQRQTIQDRQLRQKSLKAMAAETLQRHEAEQRLSIEDEQLSSARKACQDIADQYNLSLLADSKHYSQDQVIEMLKEIEEELRDDLVNLGAIGTSGNSSSGLSKDDTPSDTVKELQNQLVRAEKQSKKLNMKSNAYYIISTLLAAATIGLSIITLALQKKGKLSKKQTQIMISVSEMIGLSVVVFGFVGKNIGSLSEKKNPK